MFYTPLIRLEAPPSSSIQSEVDQPKPFSLLSTNIFAPFQKNVRSKVAVVVEKRNPENEEMNAIDMIATEMASRVVPKVSQKA